jgi:type I restriction enzyme, S subunit
MILNFKIGECCQVLSSKRIFANDYVDHGIPFYRSKEIIHKALNKFEGDEVFIKEDRFNDIKNKFGAPKKGDLLISAVGNRSGICYCIKEEYDFYFKDGNLIWLKNFNDKLTSEYLAYLLNSEHGQGMINNIFIGAAQKALTIDAIKKIKLNLPPLTIQKRIASILSAYDDLIENNLKRIKLLEEIAKRTYEEWFVKFRVNGEELSIDEATGLPVGWKQITVNDYVEVIGKGPALNYDFQGQKYPVINQSCIRNGEIELEKVLYAQELNANKEYCYLKTNDILINSMGQGTLGRVSKNVSIRNERFIIHNCITFLRAKKELSQFQLYYFISSKQSYFISVSQGSTGQTTLKQSLVGDLEINLPTNSILNSFNNIIEPIWNQMGVLKNQNSNLKQSRDILLPRLMSGTINVES